MQLIPSIVTRTKKKGQPIWAALCVLSLMVRLRQVVAEGGPEHVVDALCLDATYARPAKPLSVAVLDALAETAVFAAVDVIPVATGELLHVPCLVSAGAAGVVACRAAVEAGIRVGKAA